MLRAHLAAAMVRRPAEQQTEAKLYRYVRVQRRFAPLIDHLVELGAERH
jgi:hypothetical protein